MNLLYLIGQSAAADPIPLECADSQLVFAAFDQTPALLFHGPGIQQLVAPGTELAARQQMFADYGIDKLFVCTEDLAEQGITPDALILPVQMVPREALPELLQAQDVVLSDCV